MDDDASSRRVPTRRLTDLRAALLRRVRTDQRLAPFHTVLVDQLRRRSVISELRELFSDRMLERYRHGNAQTRLGIVRSLKGPVQERLLRTLPWHGRNGQAARRLMARLNQQLPPSQRFGTPRFTLDARSRVTRSDGSVGVGELTDGIWYATRQDGSVILLRLYESKSASRSNYSELWSKHGHGQVVHDLRRLRTEPVIIDGRNVRHADGTLLLPEDLGGGGERLRVSLSVPREHYAGGRRSPVPADQYILDRVRAKLRRSGFPEARLTMHANALSDDAAERLTELLFHLITDL